MRHVLIHSEFRVPRLKRVRSVSPERAVKLSAVVDLARQNLTGQEISARLHIPMSVVYSHLKRTLNSEERRSLYQPRGPKPRLSTPNPGRLRRDEENEQLAKRNHQMGVLRLEGKTLQEIGSAFGLTRERVRQCLDKLGVQKPVATKPFSLPGAGVMFRWLYDAGYRRCRGECKLWKPLAEFTRRPTGKPVCRCLECGRKYMRKQYAEHRERMIANARKWQRAHPEKVALYCKRWYFKRQISAQEKA